MCVCVRERDRERETESETESETERDLYLSTCQVVSIDFPVVFQSVPVNLTAMTSIASSTPPVGGTATDLYTLPAFSRHRPTSGEAVETVTSLCFFWVFFPLTNSKLNGLFSSTLSFLFSVFFLLLLRHRSATPDSL